jgi:Heterokaryon incompatibility protein (HET)
VVQHKSSITWSELPQTFRDSIDMAEKLSLRYIWVDSLCIVGDCDDDWKKEAARMRDAYKNGEITIAATKASYAGRAIILQQVKGKEVLF